MQIPIRFQFFLLLLFYSFTALAQQNGNIKGKVTTADGEPAAYVSIGLKNKNQGTSTTETGEYNLSRIKPGNYTLSVSAVGINKQEKNITVSAGQVLVVNFSLTENSQTLKEISIKATKNKYKVTTPSSSLRLEGPILEAPQNIQIVSNQTLADQQIISMSDGLIKNVSGANKVEHWGDLYTNITMRGSQIQAFRNGFNVVSSYWGPLTEDMSFVDHIEFVKGPAGFMLASGDPSGLYNVVTKKPTGSNAGEVSLTAGSFDLYRGTIDIDRKLTADGKLLFRLNGAAQNKKSHRDFEYNDRYSLAPVLSYQLGNNTKITAEYTWQKAKMSEVGSYYIFSTAGYATLPVNFTFTDPGVPATNITDQSASLNIVHQLNSHWKLTAQGAYYNYDQVGYSSWPSKVNTNGTVIRNVGIWDANSTMYLGQVFANGNFTTGKIQHRVLIGVDAGKKNYIADWGQSHDLDTDAQLFNVYQPVYGSPANGYPNFDRLTSLEDRAIKAGGLMDQKYTAIYLQEELGFFDNALRLTLAGRYTNLNQSAWGAAADKAEHFTPRFGLSYSVNKQTAVYALYDQAFIPQSGTLSNGASVQPITGNNIEFGVKKDWFDGSWNTTLSVYRILKNNELTADPTAPANSGLSIELGQKRAQGIEFDVRGELTRGLNLIANYAYTDAIVSKVAANVASSIAFEGQRISGSNKHTINSWLNYKFQGQTLNGFGLTGGFTYLIDRATGSYSTTVPAQNLPDYFKLDGGAFWEKGKIKVTGNVFNILDKYLYNGAYYSDYFNNAAYSWQTEAPRNFRINIAYKF